MRTMEGDQCIIIIIITIIIITIIIIIVTIIMEGKTHLEVYLEGT